MVEFKTNITKIVDYPVKEGSSTRVFECELPPGINFPYISGQFAMIAHDDVRLLANPALMKWASYSISSSPHQAGKLEFCVGDGSPTGVSRKLMTMKHGEQIFVRGAFGKFILDENAPEYIFLATGTGIAPLISMIRFLLSKGKTVPISLYYGFRYPEQYMYHPELEELSKKHSNLKLFPVASRPENGWKYSQGHIQDVLKDFKSHNHALTKIYICGKPEIAEELVQFCLNTMKFSPENVITEKW